MSQRLESSHVQKQGKHHRAGRFQIRISDSQQYEFYLHRMCCSADIWCRVDLALSPTSPKLLAFISLLHLYTTRRRGRRRPQGQCPFLRPGSEAATPGGRAAPGTAGRTAARGAGGGRGEPRKGKRSRARAQPSRAPRARTPPTPVFRRERAPLRPAPRAPGPANGAAEEVNPWRGGAARAERSRAGSVGGRRQAGGQEAAVAVLRRRKEEEEKEKEGAASPAAAFASSFRPLRGASRAGAPVTAARVSGVLRAERRRRERPGAARRSLGGGTAAEMMPVSRERPGPPRRPGAGIPPDGAR